MASGAPTADDTAEIAFVLNLLQADLVAPDETVSRPALEAWWGRRTSTAVGSRATSIVDTWVANGWIEELKPVVLSASTLPSYSLRLSVQSVRELAARPPRNGGNDDASLTSPDDGMSLHSKGALFDAAFPSLGPAAKKSYIKLHDPTVILYATMGLQLVVCGASTVATFSRDMKTMGVDAQTRTIVTNYLAKTIPTTKSSHQPAPGHHRPLA